MEGKYTHYCNICYTLLNSNRYYEIATHNQNKNSSGRGKKMFPVLFRVLEERDGARKLI